MRNRLWLAAALVGVTAAAIPASLTAARPSPPGQGVLAFQRGFSLATINMDGTNLTLLTSGNSYGAEWSPDGTKIAFIQRMSSYNQDMMVINADGTGLVDLTPTPDPEYGLAWSPDGTQVMIGSTSADPSRQSDILLMNVDGTNQVLLTDTDGFPEYPGGWSPDGTKLYWQAGTSVVVADLDGSNQQTIATGYTEPEWSPDGGALVVKSSADSELYLITPDGTTIRQLTNTPNDGEGAASWSPDGKKLVFSRWNSSVTKVDLYRMNRDGTDVVQITDDDVSDWSPDWKPTAVKGKGK